MKPVLPIQNTPDTEFTWREPPEQLALPEGQAHVWRASLEQPAAILEKLWQTLSFDERERANRYRFERDRNWYIVRRGGLRQLLGFYLGMEPTSLRFSYNSYGKPFLHPTVAVDLHFNLSHSKGLALYAFVDCAEVGVDIEWARADFDHLKLAERFFSACERSELCALPPELRMEAFFLGWTRKEAIIKAHGEGLSLPLDQFDVSLTPGKPARLLAAGAGLEAPDQWSLFNLAPAPGHPAALAIQGRGYELCCWAEIPFKAREGAVESTGMNN